MSTTLAGLTLGLAKSPVAVTAVVLLARITWPAEPDIAMPPVKSGVGRAALGVEPAASCTSRYAPAPMVPLRLVTCAVLPADERYWTDHPFRLTGAAERLCSSMKSLV